MPYWSKFQSNSASRVKRIWGPVPGDLKEYLRLDGQDRTLTNNNTAINTIVLPDGRSAWQFQANVSGNLALGGSSVNETGYYGGAAMVRFRWNGYHAGNTGTQIMRFGNFCVFGTSLTRINATVVNGYNAVAQESTGSLVVGNIYCVICVDDHITGTIKLYVNGTLAVTHTRTGSWTANSTIGISPTFGEATGTAQRAAYDIIEAAQFFGTDSQTAVTLSNTEIAAITAGDCFLEVTRPTHPSTDPPTFTTRIIGGTSTQVHDGSLRRANQPTADVGSIVGTGTRTGPGNLTVADASPVATGRKFYRIEVASTGGISMQTYHYGGGSPLAGGYVRGAWPVAAIPTTANFAALAGCPKIGVIADSRGVANAAHRDPYRIMRGGTLENVLSVSAPGSGPDDWVPGAPAVTGVMQLLNGTTRATSGSLMDDYLAEAAAGGITATVLGPFGVNDSSEANDPTSQAQWTAVVNALTGAGHKVIILRDPWHESNNTTMQRQYDKEAFIATLLSTNVFYSDDAFQQFVANYADYITIDGVHLSTTSSPLPPLNPTGSSIGGQAIANIIGNYVMLAAQTALTPGVVLTINNAVGEIEPGGQITRTLTLRPTNGYTGNVSIAITGLPTGITASLSPTSPVNIPSSSNVNVTLTLTAAIDAPLASGNEIIIEATAGTIDSALTLLLDVIDETPPAVDSVTINGTGVTVQLNSPCTGTTGFSFFENGGLVPLSGALTNVDGLLLTGTLSVAFSGGTTATWSYNQATGNIVDAGGNELPTASGQAATNNTPSSGGGTGTGEPEVEETETFLLTNTPQAVATSDCKLQVFQGSVVCVKVTASTLEAVPADGYMRLRAESTADLPANFTVADGSTLYAWRDPAANASEVIKLTVME